MAKYVFLLGCVCTALFPLVWVFMSSFKTNAEILSNGISLPSRFSFDGYTQALKISPILQYFFNSVVITSITTVVNVFFLAMAAYIFARYQFRGKNILYLLLSLSLVIPMTALLHPVYMTINALHLANKKSGLVLVYTALNLPMSLLILRGTFQSIPRSMEEAAVMDGAGFVRVFFQIMLPMAKSGLASAGVLTFLNCWNEFTFALVLTSSQSARTLPLSLSYFTSQFSFNYTAMFAAIVIAIIPSIVVFALFQEQIVRSLTAGAIKE
ncbi:MAG: carbohydrate ABC transporter permease [Spirochaetales bacterium]|nr:carbohydrate ABC transporter permease [Spirochaetales bacterium]